MSDQKNAKPSQREKALEQFIFPKRIERLDRVLSQRTSSLTVVLDGVHNHHNISAVIRSADAFGVRAVHLIGDGFSYARGITLGTERWIEIERHKNGAEALEKLRAGGFQIAVTAPEDDERAPHVKTVPVYDLPFEQPLAIVFGNERTGVSPELFAAAQYHAFIPMVGFVESLNISVACALTLFSSTFSNAERKRRVPVLADQEREDLRGEWLIKGTKRADIILREIERREDGEA